MSTSRAGRRNLEVRIGDVLLDGVEAADQRKIAAALEAALVQVFSEEDAGGHLARDRSLDRVVVRGGPPPKDDADQGLRAARSIFRGVTDG